MASSSTDETYFSKDLISPEVVSNLPAGYSLRPIKKSDRKDVLEVLSVLTKVGDISQTAWDERFDWITKRNDSYFILSICDENAKVVAVGSLIVEKKFIRNCGIVGHIEDIAVSKEQQGKKLGLRLIQALDFIAEKSDCYKSILDCSETNKGFYEKCGFKFVGIEMAHYYVEAPAKPADPIP